MQMINRNDNFNTNCYMMDNNPHSMNNHHSASMKFGTWRRQKVEGRRWRNENEDYGNVMASGGDGYRFGKITKNKQFRNRNEKKVNRFNNGGGVRFQPYVAERKARVMAVTPAERDVLAVAVGDDGESLASRGLLGEVEKEWGLNMYGTMSGLIRLRSDGCDGVDCDEGGSSSGGSDVDGEHVQFERRLSKYEIILPNNVSGSSASNDLYSDGERKSIQLEKENVMMKQSLSVIDRGMDDLKRRMEILEMQLRAKVNKEVKIGDSSVEKLGMLSVCA